MNAPLVFGLAFAAEFAGDVLAVNYQTAVRKLWRGKAARWAGLLALLSWVDLGGIAAGWPIWALVTGSVTGGMAGTWYSVGRNMVRERWRKKRRLERAAQRGMDRRLGRAE